jgi:hemerythrin
MAMAWTAALAVGVEEIDQQHRELFYRLNTLLVSMQEGRGRSEIERTLEFLGEYVRVHFSAEEKLMLKHGYPAQAAQAHRKEHADFIRDFGELQKEFQAEGATSALVFKVQRGVCDWLLGHIGGTDLELAKFVKTQQRGLARPF